MIHQFAQDRTDPIVGIWRAGKLVSPKPRIRERTGPGNRLLALAEEGWRVLRDYRLPDWCGCRIRLNFADSTIKLFYDSVRRDLPELGIDGTKRRLAAHPDLAA